MRTKMTHGFPELDHTETVKNYCDDVKAQADYSIETLKREAEYVKTRVKYYADNADAHLMSLIDSIESLQDEWEVHADCATQDDISRLEEYNDDLERDLKETEKKLANAVYLLEECEKLASGALLEKIKGVIYD